MRATLAIGSILVLTFCVGVTIFPSEFSLLTTKTSWAIKEDMLVYVYLTNRPYNVTHGNDTFPNAPAAPTPTNNTTPVNPADGLLGPGGDIWKKALFVPQVDQLSRFWLGNSA